MLNKKYRNFRFGVMFDIIEHYVKTTSFSIGELNNAENDAEI